MPLEHGISVSLVPITHLTRPNLMRTIGDEAFREVNYSISLLLAQVNSFSGYFDLFAASRSCAFVDLSEGQVAALNPPSHAIAHRTSIRATPSPLP